MDAMTFAAFHLDAQRATEQRRELAIRGAQAARRAARAEERAHRTASPAVVCAPGELALAGPSA